MTAEATASRRIELWVQAHPTWTDDRHRDVATRLEALAAENRIDEYSVHVWGKFADMSADDVTIEDVIERVHDLGRWVERTGAKIPGLSPRTVGVGRMGPTHVTESLPEHLLIVLRDERVEWAVPCRYDGHRYDIEGWLAEIEGRPTERAIPTAAGRRPKRSVRSARVPRRMQSARTSRPTRPSTSKRTDPRRESEDRRTRERRHS